MCMIANINNKDIESLGDLKKELNLSTLPLIYNHIYIEEENSNDCLCLLDISKLAKDISARVDDDYFYYTFSLNNSNPGVFKKEI
jgi:hypothetical protein